MQILARAVDSQLVGRNPAKTVGDRRLPLGILAAVADHDTITGQTIAKIGQHPLQVRAAHLLFALDQKLHLQRQRLAGSQPIADALNVRQHLALVVRRAAGVEIAVADGRLEGPADPLVQRFDGLDVIVSINHNDRGSVDFGGFRVHHRMPLGRQDLDWKYRPIELVGQPTGGLLNVDATGSVAADTWDSSATGPVHPGDGRTSDRSVSSRFEADIATKPWSFGQFRTAERPSTALQYTSFAVNENHAHRRREWARSNPTVREARSMIRNGRSANDGGRATSRNQKATEEKAQETASLHVILWDDADHSYDYVVLMMKQVFRHPIETGFQIAKEVDSSGRAICLTTTLEHAELKRDQIHAFGKDELIARCKGSMSATIEPVGE